MNGHGYGLVAVTDDPDGPIVGEATYFLLDNGNGELAVTVAPRWRGWLGPYLLDALLTSAAARGVPNLEAEILVENRRMLAIMRRHGYAIVDGADVSTVRLVVGTSTPTPTWPEPHDHARVLVEAPGGRWRNEQAAREAGLQVMVCPVRAPGDPRTARRSRVRRARSSPEPTSSSVSWPATGRCRGPATGACIGPPDDAGARPRRRHDAPGDRARPARR